ncbi:pectinesterase family protein [[Clostridium] fimetarium]|uniref:Pectin methylesterase n=1 Tax=[Clostridium] fimetarium TaxID=99656 RepID=A0A1I0QU64_9FIRM|nr:pectinesterase family protein [[Clostridium] fimetarium]SEW30505.1 Pectin methylesterase [[Clostridium] fimetarium]
MMFMKSKTLRKTLAIMFSFIMVAMLAIPSGGFGFSSTAYAASTKAVDGDYFFDFRDGSIIPTTTKGNVDVTYETMKVLVGTKNAYGYNGAQHGVQFKAGNSIEIAVTGPTKISVGDCQYSNGQKPTTMTLSSSDGSYTQTCDSAKACYDDNGNNMIVFTYKGDAATTLVLSFTGSTYVPVIKVESLSKTYAFTNQSIITSSTATTTDTTYGSLKVLAGTSSYYNHMDVHGSEFHPGNSFQLSVSGATKVSVGDCKYSDFTSMTLKSADGSYSETINATRSETGILDFKYTSVDATVLTLTINGGTKAYISSIKTSAIFEEVGDVNGVPKDSVHAYNFSDGSVVATSYDAATRLTSFVTSTDGFLKVVSAGSLYTHDKQHGLAIYNGDSFEVKVSGDAVVTFNLCQYGADKTATIVASNKKGAITSSKTQLLQGTENDGLSQASFQYAGVATTLVFTISTPVAGAEMYLHGMNVSDLPAAQATPTLVGNGKVDVWDLGAQQLDTAKYNNMLSESIINSWYPSTITAGSAGNSLGSFATAELMFVAQGYTNNRLRTSNKNLTRYDEKTDIIVDGTTLSGYVYSNNAANATLSLDVKAYKNDILTVYAGSNGADSTIYCVSPTGVIQQGMSNGTGVKLTFAAPEYGLYKIYSTDEKLVIYRVERAHTQPILVTGNVDITAATGIAAKNYKINFTNKQTGEVIETSVVGGSYSAYLNEEFDYNITLANANGYIISSQNAVKYAKGTGNSTLSITIKSVDLATVTGEIVGLSAAALANLKLSFVNTDMIYVPDFTISGTTITAKLEKGVTYKIVANNINDYYLSDISTINKTADVTQNITFALKPTYKVSLNLAELPINVAAGATVTFTNINETGYKYTFNAADPIKLRDGQYKVVVKNIGTDAYVQALTSDLKVNGADVSKTVKFKNNTSWDFSVYNGNPGIETIAGSQYYLGLALTGAVLENKTYLLVNTDGQIAIPVKKGNIVNLSYCYCASFSIDGVQAVDAKSGSTTQIDSYQYVATQDGVVTVKGTAGTTSSQTYFTSIAVSATVPYSAKVYVGADKQYKTINAALDDVKKMARLNNERVEIVINPGNYEEMLTINIPNVSLVNAAGTSASIALANKGVDITNNAVRITSYYGHGYSYYSMISGCKYDEETLAVNEENGYLTTVNPGSGTTNGSYWNATVVVNGSGFEANGIIFENSYNQYISAKEANDTVVEWATGGKGTRPTTVGDTSVQNKSFVERAAAIAVNGDKSVFSGCKFIGRQDTLYGATGITSLFQKCDILGATDYIFGGITAVFYQCNLTMNTDSAATADTSYITAAQQSTGRGYLMYNCNVTSTTPGVDTASAYRSKPGYFGRPWAANTSEVVFYKTTVQATDDSNNVGASLISKIGWLDSLGGQSTKMYEYGTMDATGVDNSTSRATWSSVLTTPVLNDGTAISIAAFLGDWVTTLQARGLALDLTDSQFTSLSTVTGTLEERLAAYNSLTTVITSAGAITSTVYTTDSYATLTAAIKAAKAIVSTDALGTINSTTTALNSAVAGLTKKGADYSALNKAITDAQALTSSMYTANSYAAVTTALQAAKAVDSTLKIDAQATVDAARTSLNNAIAGLTKLGADYTALNKAIADAQALSATIYTASSYASVTTALQAAKAVDATLKIDAQETINSATTALNNAIKALDIQNEVIPAVGVTGGQVVDITNVIPSGAKLAIQSVVFGTAYDTAAAIVKQSSNNLSQFAVFEINLTDSSNTAITLLGDKVRVTLPIPSVFDLTKTISVFRVESNGSLTKLDTQIVDRKCIFETNHFSTYVIGEVAATITTTDPATVVTTDTAVTATTVDTTTKTGDTSPIMVYLVLFMVSVGAAMLVIRAKKKEVKE